MYELLTKQNVRVKLPASQTLLAILAKVKEPEKNEEEEPQDSKLLSVDELTSNEEVALRAGFKLGNLVYEKSRGCAAN